MSGYTPKKMQTAKLVHQPANMMVAGLAPRIGKSNASIRLYYQRVDECYCYKPCPPLIITDAIIWFPYNNALDAAGNSLPQRSNYIAIQFNRRLFANPPPTPFPWEITGDACISGPPSGSYTGNPIPTFTQLGQRIYLNPLASPPPFGRFPFELSINMPSNFIEDPPGLSNRISPPAVYLMDDLKFVDAAGNITPGIQVPGQWLVFWVGHGPNANPLNGPITQYETINATGNSIDDGGIKNDPNTTLEIKISYIPDASGLNAGVPTAGATFPDPGPLLYTDDCDGFRAPLSGFNSNFITFTRKNP